MLRKGSAEGKIIKNVSVASIPTEESGIPIHYLPADNVSFLEKHPRYAESLYASVNSHPWF